MGMRIFGAGCGLVLLVLGGVMTAIGLGLLGDAGNGASWYATVGPATAGLGVALAWVSVAPKRH
ncbi:hypothetical protein [Nocardioides jejuensis]|uniref:Uncharacterized protein n=1 Tax=Nocardioides jejuensis TaxID=2502782 RepID=A0A4R1CJZ5_9ACTN|nr:hypothetical protein [Nocardioides jejuensis]TCJ31207.1 hypothetical protein EPD65_01150 [Nocardioides jejuensis]